MINTQPGYIKRHVIKDPRTVEIWIVVEEDYNPGTDGFHCYLISSSLPLSMPQDNSGGSDIERIMFHLRESIDIYELTPNTEYRITMIECAEYDGAPVLMQTWAIQEVVTFDLGMHIVSGG